MKVNTDASTCFMLIGSAEKMGVKRGATSGLATQYH